MLAVKGGLRTVKKLTLVSYLPIVGVLVLAGCKNSDDTAFDEVGEMRVFNGSHHAETTPKDGSSSIHSDNVAAPRPVVSETAVAEKTTGSEVAVAAKPATKSATPVVAARRAHERSTNYRHVMVGELNMDD
jgi:uncharacterized lipoprotein NlpE involved in copper resistance